MATKNFMTLENLTTYDGLIKQYIAEGDADSIKAVALDNNILKFYDVETPTVQTQPKYSIELPTAEGFMPLIEDATGDKVVTSNSDGSVSESNYTMGAVFDNIISPNGKGVVTGHLASDNAHEYLITTAIDSGYDVTTYTEKSLSDILGEIQTAYETGYSAGSEVVNKMNKFSSTPAGTGYIVITDENSSENSVAVSSVKAKDVLTGYSEYDGYITMWDKEYGNYITDAGIAASNVATKTFVGTIPAGSSATTVVGYVDEVAGSITTASDVTLVEAQTPTTGYLKTYELYQGGNAAANLVGKIDIPKDLVVTSGEIVVNPTGQPAGTYLKLTIANQTTPVYINVADLCDAYTAASGATQVQLAISNTNEISATLVAGGVGTTELASSAVTTAKIADDAVTAAKVNISAHSETDTGVAIDSNDDTSYNIITVEVETTDGQVSNVDVTVNDLESFVSAKIGYEVPNMIIDNINALDADVVQSAGADGLALEVIQTDGLITSVTGSIASNTYDAYGAASTVQSTVVGTLGDAPTASTVYGAKAYADAATAPISTADINALFSSNSNN